MILVIIVCIESNWYEHYHVKNTVFYINFHIINQLYCQLDSVSFFFQRICMLSNFLASLFLGDYAPIDYGDGSMLNLLDIRSHHWFTKCVEVSLANLSNTLR